MSHWRPAHPHPPSLNGAERAMELYEACIDLHLRLDAFVEDVQNEDSWADLCAGAVKRVQVAWCDLGLIDNADKDHLQRTYLQTMERARSLVPIPRRD
jgi:hypothetical protein